MAGSAVACLRDGLDWNNFYAAQIYHQVAYHDFEGITVDPDEKPRLVADLGDRNLMILRNHGLLALGATVPSAFTALWTLQRACEIELAAQQTGQPLQPVTEQAALQSSREALSSPRAWTPGARSSTPSGAPWTATNRTTAANRGRVRGRAQSAVRMRSVSWCSVGWRGLFAVTGSASAVRARSDSCASVQPSARSGA
jgi:hypothetical protein